MTLKLDFSSGSGKFSERIIVKADDADLVLEGFPSHAVGWHAKLTNGKASATYTVDGNGTLFVPRDSSAFVPGIIYMTVRRYVNGAVVDQLAVEPLTVTEDNGTDVLKPIVDMILGQLEDVACRVKIIEDSQYGFAFETT